MDLKTYQAAEAGGLVVDRAKLPEGCTIYAVAGGGLKLTMSNVTAKKLAQLRDALYPKGERRGRVSRFLSWLKRKASA